uniref:Metalloendopeptidase n=1 Tax=Acrobeloides nanus TaxID=290746 RepID=A0A914CAB5_9BILA
MQLQQLLLTFFLPFYSNASPSISTKDVVDKDREPRETVLTPDDFMNVPAKEIDLRTIGIHVPDDPTMGNKTEGDIATPEIKKFMDPDPSYVARSSIRQSNRRWFNNEIPYTLSSQYGSYSRSVIAKAMNEYHLKTCIKFIPRDANKHRDYVYIHPDDGCYSLVGRVGGRQPLSLDSGCIQTGTIVHELMHTVGFFHEQSRYDRDDFIEIAWPNVMKGANDQFEKYGTNVIDELREPYDYSSIMHYGPYAFSANGKRTILARKPGAQKMGQRVQFSEIDLKKINKLYHCDASKSLEKNVIQDLDSKIPITQQPLITQKPPHPPKPQGQCEDLNWRCHFWSMSIFGYCDKYEEIRSQICRKSCRSCIDVLTVKTLLCDDRSLSCKGIRKRSCTSPLTSYLCRATCGFCDIPTLI